jgi:hypothetical protein
MSIQFHYSRQSITVLRLTNSYLRKRLLSLEKELEKVNTELNLLRGKYDQIPIKPASNISRSPLELVSKPVQEAGHNAETGEVQHTGTTTYREAGCKVHSK